MTRSARGSKGAASAPYARDARYPLARRGPPRGRPAPTAASAGRGPQPAARSPQPPSRFEYREAPELGRRVVTAAKELLATGLSSAEVCSLFTHAAATLAEQKDGMPREEWLELCAELFDHRQEGRSRAGEVAKQIAVNSLGGDA